MNDGVPIIFDRALLRRRRDRMAASRDRGSGDPRDADFLFRETASHLADRLMDVRRTFPLALDLGARDGAMLQSVGNAGGIQRFVHCDLSAGLLGRMGSGWRVATDEERLPFRAGTFDLVLSNLALHWVNDLPGALAQIRAVLKPDGLFLAAMLGAGTLGELRQCLIEAEVAETGGAAIRVSPFAALADAASLLQRAGFALPVADQAAIQVTYPDAMALMRDLRAMGETSALVQRTRRNPSRSLFARAAALYAQRFSGVDGRIVASFQILYLAGWSPHASQQRPARRGSAKVRLRDALEAKES